MPGSGCPPEAAAALDAAAGLLDVLAPAGMDLPLCEERLPGCWLLAAVGPEACRLLLIATARAAWPAALLAPAAGILLPDAWLCAPTGSACLPRMALCEALLLVALSLPARLPAGWVLKLATGGA